MGFLDRILPNDQTLAATKHKGRTSATDKAAAKRLAKHHASGAAKAAAKGETWEEADRRRFS